MVLRGFQQPGRRHTNQCFLGIAFVYVMLFACPVFGAGYWYANGGYEWKNAFGGAVPTLSDEVFLGHGRTGYVDSSGNYVGNLKIGAAAKGGNLFIMQGGDLTANTIQFDSRVPLTDTLELRGGMLTVNAAIRSWADKMVIRVVGGQSQLAGSGTGQIYGTMEFVLDSSGISRVPWDVTFKSGSILSLKIAAGSTVRGSYQLFKQGVSGYSLVTQSGVNWDTSRLPVDGSVTVLGAQVTDPSPADAAIKVPLDVLLSWLGPAGSVNPTYTVYLDTDSDFSDIAPAAAGLTATSWQPDAPLMPATEYFWRVDVQEGADLIPGAVWRFQTLPLCVTECKPSHGEADVKVGTPLTWTKPAYAENILYDVYLGTSPVMADNPKAAAGISDSIFIPDIDFNTTYYWWVDILGAGGEISSAFSFSTAREVVSESVPEDGTHEAPTDIILTWSGPALTGLTYDVYLSTDSDLSSATPVAQGLTTASYDPPGLLNEGQTYYWRVDMHNDSSVAAGETLSFTVQAPTAGRACIYPFLVNPRQYPDFTRRPVPVPTWDTFHGKPQFVGNRYNWDDFVNQVIPGKVLRPNLGFMQRSDIHTIIEYLGANGYYLHNIGGYGPGSPFSSSFGQLQVSDTFNQFILDNLGDRFTGWDIGEQDGRYNFVYQKIIEPFWRDKFLQYLNAHRYLGQVGDDLGNLMSLLSVYWYWHYPIKDGDVLLAGAECQNKVTNPQIHYHFLRGAGKQYGVLWFGDVSIFDTWGCKSYWSTPTEGNSLSLMKRMLYLQYLYNSTILGFEGGLRRDDTDTPIATIHRSAEQFMSNYQPGVMHAPVALLTDFLSGWMPGRHWRGSYVVWNALPYAPGDHLTHNVLSMLYPRYEDCGFYQNEQGAVADTPYGDMADGLLTDADPAIMDRYGVIVAAGDLFSTDTELRDKVNSYVNHGGHFVVTGENAKRLWPEWNIGASETVVPAGSSVHWTGSGMNLTENYLFTFSSMDLPHGAQVLADYNGDPLVVRLTQGYGQITVCLSPFGMNRDAQPYTDPGNAYWNPNLPLGRPYFMLNHVKALLNDVFSTQKLFSAGDGLCYVTNRKSEGEYTIGVFNNSLFSRPFQIVSHIGPITQIAELNLGTSVKDEVGYWPTGYEDNDGGASDASHISGGDVRLFAVSVNENGVRLMDPKLPAPRPVNRMVSVDSAMRLKEKLLSWPAFFQHMDGLKLDWKAFRAMDVQRSDREDDLWIRRQQVRLVVDCSSGMRSEQLTLKKDLSEGSAYLQTLEIIDNLIAKMQEFSPEAKDIVLCVDNSEAQATADVVAGLVEVCSMAQEAGITVHLKHYPTALTFTMAETISIVDSVETTNLRVALDTSLAGSTAELESLLMQAEPHLGMILVVPNSASMDYKAVRDRDVIQVLDACYRDWDGIYRNIKSVWHETQNLLPEGVSKATIKHDFRTVQAGTENHLLALHHIEDIRETVLSRSKFFRYFGGVKIDSEYLSSRDLDQCILDRQWLKSKGLAVVVDFSSRINGYPDLTFINSVHPAYQESVAVMDDVLEKMEAIGSRDAIISTHMQPEAHIEESTAYSMIKQGMADFCLRAAQRGITVYLQHNPFKSWGSVNEVKTIISEIAPLCGNLKMAINTNHSTNLSELITNADSDLGVIVLGQKGSTACDIHLPLSTGGVNIASLSERTELQILDAEYTGWDVVEADCAYLGWEPKYPCGYPLAGDFNEDCIVDLSDFIYLADEWMLAGSYWISDVDDDNLVDLEDLLAMTENWLTCGETLKLVNGSFELPEVSGYELVLPSFWSWSGSGMPGLQDGGAQQSGQRLYCNAPSGVLSQTLQGEVKPLTTYALNFYTASSNTGKYSIVAKLILDSMLVAYETYVPPTGEIWQPYSISYTTTEADGGKPLRVEFQYSTISAPVQAWLDEVTLLVNN